jgi:hypothetical protein
MFSVCHLTDAKDIHNLADTGKEGKKKQEENLMFPLLDAKLYES